MKSVLVTSGYPRSGNTYLNQALNLIYYPEEEVYINFHSTKAIQRAQKIIVPFRNPTDSISSWHIWPSNEKLKLDVKFYIRFHSFVLDNLNKVVLMDFDYFTKDINYINNKVLKHFDIQTKCYVTDAQVKEAMVTNGKDINLPRNNKEELALVREQLQNTAGFDKCLELYAQLKEQSL